MTRPPAGGKPAVPLAILVDYDGTIARTDVGDVLMGAFVTPEWERWAARYDAGLIGSRRFMEWEVAQLEVDPAELRALAAAQPHDPGFAPMVERARSVGVPVEVVSDGFGFYIPAALAALGLPDVPIITAETTFDASGRATIAFPNGHPTCFVCGTCKRARVLEHQAAGRTVVFVGDGESDRYAAGYADVVFAKGSLARLCEANGWSYRPWEWFADVDAWLAETIAAWRSDPTSLPGPQVRPYFCGPEVWGEGLYDPPAPVAGADRGAGGEGVAPG